MLFPFLLQLVFVLAPSSSVFGFSETQTPTLRAIASLSGFVFLVRGLGWLSSFAALAYFPAMVVLLPRFAWLFTGFFYGVWD